MSISCSKREEEYLEAMYILMLRKGSIRVKDLAELLQIKPPSVVEFLDRLASKGLVKYEKHGVIELTEKGIEIAKRIYERHEALKKFLRNVLNLPEEIAEEDACKIEHYLHEETIRRIIKFLEFLEKFELGKKLLQELNRYLTS